jgi:hypothetical protein
MEKTKAQSDIVQDVKRRVRDELRELDLMLVDLKVVDLDAEEKATIEKVSMFMKDTTYVTEKQTDVIGTTELYEKYLQWNKEKNHEIFPNIPVESSPHIPIRSCNSINYIKNTCVLGKYLVHLNYTPWKAKREGKTIRGYGYLKYKDSADTSISVKEYMEKYTERTGSVKDRVAISKLLPKFYSENKERYGLDTFKHKLVKYGYHTKAAKETQRVEGRYGQEKVIKIGEEVQCVLKVRLKNSFFREEWSGEDERLVNFGE